MNRANALSIIAAPLLEANSMLPDASIFVFGSLLSDSECISDVDVLVIYETEEGLPQLKNCLHQLDLRIPMDITYMSKNEERQFQFIKQQRALPVETVCITEMSHGTSGRC